jgi:hypothetical protein
MLLQGGQELRALKAAQDLAHRPRLAMVPFQQILVVLRGLAVSEVRSGAKVLADPPNPSFVRAAEAQMNHH